MQPLLTARVQLPRRDNAISAPNYVNSAVWCLFIPEELPDSGYAVISETALLRNYSRVTIALYPLRFR